MRRPFLIFTVAIAAAASCKRPPAVDSSEEKRPAAAIAHGGVGSPPEWSDGCKKAVDAALAVLEKGGDPIDAAVAGVVVLEDDPRFNAGIGSRVRIDGVTVQMDAAVMNSDGKFGAVAGVEQVKNPVLVARAVTNTPHLLLAGDGATRFARTLGLEPFDVATAERLAETSSIQADLIAGADWISPAWRTFDWRKHWNFEKPLAETGLARGKTEAAPQNSDTVGVAVRAADGTFAVALSTGGTAITLRGRVGDVPILGAGLFAGKRGAIAATGTGERIMEAGLARAVHAWLEQGLTVFAAAGRGVEQLAGKGDIGLIVIGEKEMTAAADRPMAWAARELGSDQWKGP